VQRTSAGSGRESSAGQERIHQQSLLLDGEKAFTLVDLAALLEKLGDWPGAMENYSCAVNSVALQQNTSGPNSSVTPH